MKKGKTQTYLDKNPEAKAKKKAYDSKYQKSPEQVKKRVERNRNRREALKDGRVRKGDGKDISHTKNGLRVKPKSVNRGSSTDMPGDRVRAKKK